MKCKRIQSMTLPRIYCTARLKERKISYMKIVMCIKPVSTAILYPDEDRNEKMLINPYDLFALSNLLELKRNCNCHIICICMGAQDSKEVLMKCLAMGVDEAILLYDSKAFAGADTVATTKVLAKAISKINDYDLIVCGMKTIDGETGQVPFGLAERLHINYINNIENIKSIMNNEVTVSKRIDNSLVVGNQLLPALVIYNNFTLTNNYVTLLGMKKAQKKSIMVWDKFALDMNEVDCGLKGSKTQVVNLVPIYNKKECVILENNTVEQALLIQNIILKNMQGVCNE